METENTNSPSDAAAGSSDHREFLKRSATKAFDDAIKSLDFDKISKQTGIPPGELEETARHQLARLLNDFPRTTGSYGKGWSIHLLRRGHAAWEVEITYPITTGRGLIFDSEKLLEAIEYGLVDEHGNPVINPPVCTTCLRKNN